MKCVLLIGDKPGRLNLHKDIPFVGTKSFPRLVEWIGRIAPDYYIVLNSHTSENHELIIELYNHEFKVIALGDAAAKICQRLNVHYFKLPHPSPKNILINQKTLIDKLLAKAYAYIRN